MTVAEGTSRSERRCLACGGDTTRRLHQFGPYAVVQCPRCLLAWTLGAEVEPESFYDADYFIGDGCGKGYNDYLSLAAAMARTGRARLARLLRLVPRARTLLDAGCGPGFFVRQAGRLGLDAAGIEVSPYAARYGRESLRLRVHQGTIDDAALERCGGSFDLITLWDVVEHLHAPDEVLRLLARRLNPGGVLGLSTGDIGALAARISGRRWHLYNLPEHLWFFSVPALRRLLGKAGLAIVDLRRDVCWYTARYLVDRLAYSMRGSCRTTAADPLAGRRCLAPFDPPAPRLAAAAEPSAPRRARADRTGRPIVQPAGSMLTRGRPPRRCAGGPAVAETCQPPVARREGQGRGASILKRFSLPMTLFDIVTIHARPAATMPPRARAVHAR